MAVFTSVGSRFAESSGIAALLATLVVFILLQLYFTIRYPKNLPLAGESDGKRWFSLRTRWRYYADCAALYREAYEKFSKKGKTVLLPGLGFRCDVVLPQSAMGWVFSRPETALSHPEATLELVQLRSSLGHGRYKTDPWPKMLVKTDINAALEQVCADVDEELKVAFDLAFGRATDSWRDVELLPAIRRVSAQVASRFTVGRGLCRQEAYITDCLKVIDGIALNGAVMGATPQVLRPLLSPGVTLGLKRNINSIKQHIRGLYNERLKVYASDRQPKTGPAEQRTLFQMMMDFARTERPSEFSDLDVMTRRLCFANFASMHQTGILFTNVLLNIVGSDASFQTVAALRGEISHVLGSKGQPRQWTKQHVAQLVKLDSVARETLRLNSYSNRGTFRKVVEEGLETDDGVRLPKGAYISFLSHPAQCDADVFEEPFKYDPFRFSRNREDAGNTTHGRQEDGINDNRTKMSASGFGSTSFVSTSAHHLAFGHGAHSCPGRFLVDFELKMMVAYVLENYDLEFPLAYGGKRPPNRWIAEACVPPAGVKLRIRRRR